MTDTFAYLSELFDRDWTITKFKGTSDGKGTQTVYLEVQLKKRLGVPQVYREGIAK